MLQTDRQDSMLTWNSVKFTMILKIGHFSCTISFDSPLTALAING